MQVNVEIKTVIGGMPRINITDVLKPADSDDEDIPPPGKCYNCIVLPATHLYFAYGAFKNRMCHCTYSYLHEVK